ncbi:MAG TPA: dihydroorotate dehydrogenase electron transfer subunit [Firmicutes bacterium]|jgi:dihydroorotate dehydrogenase electron transfer subunit|nr:dihydroorotate dehydrogenase electron transfer subunit [Bacillota bacterium]
MTAAEFTTPILKQTRIAEDIYNLTLGPHPAMLTATPGQFVQLAVGPTWDPLLRRPFSICYVKDDGAFNILYRAQGKGTALLAHLCAGASVNVLGPLGHGFTLPQAPTSDPIVLVGGGIGTPPLVFLAQSLSNMGIRPHVTLGFTNADQVICEEYFRACGAHLSIATDDGSYGYHGLVTELLEQINKPALIYACGPRGMLAAVAHFANTRRISCQVSMEEHMACGMGVCLGCVCKTKVTAPAAPQPNAVGGPGWQWQRVCMEGPVFDAAEVIF